MTYQGTVSNGVIVLPPEVVLPEGASVAVEIKASSDPTGGPRKFKKKAASEEEFEFEIRDGIPVFPPTNRSEQTVTEGGYVFEMKSGVPLLPIVRTDFRSTMEFINQLRDEDP